MGPRLGWPSSDGDGGGTITGLIWMDDLDLRVLRRLVGEGRVAAGMVVFRRPCSA